MQRGLKKYPVQRAWPMGFRASAVIAQSVTECTAAKAGLPADRRCTPGVEAVEEPPLWGAVIDD
eukprot:8726231-Heterocapsa_arctica.AAC.1